MITHVQTEASYWIMVYCSITGFLLDHTDEILIFKDYTNVKLGDKTLAIYATDKITIKIEKH